MSPLFMVVFILGSASIAEAALAKPAATPGSVTYNSITLTFAWPSESVQTVEYEISNKDSGDLIKTIPLADKADFITYVVDGLIPDTQYTFVITATDTTSTETAVASEDIVATTSALPVPVIKFVSADEKSISLEWENANYLIYEDGRTFKAAGKDISTDSKDILIDNLTPATVVSTEATGTYKGKTSAATEKDYCTGPSKPAVSYSKTETDSAATPPTSTLLLVVDFTGGSKVTHLEIVTSEAITKLPTIEASQGTIVNARGMMTFIATLETTLDAGQKFEVTFEDFPESAFFTEVLAYYIKNGQCEHPGIVKVTEFNRANLASKEATFVYLVICLMATVLRSFGIEVWSPIGSH